MGTVEASPQYSYPPGRRGLCNAACPRIYIPVCGTDGITYPNSCVLDYYACRFNNVSYAYPGNCVAITHEQKPCPDTCPFDYSPVCGSDGNTYANKCTFESSACTDSSLHIVAYRSCGEAAY
uniref:Kazal-like domain-containing protein n=1 Tax=Scylla olivacea TaxID=85551 RepID=A0A0P4VTC7_SCYOL